MEEIVETLVYEDELSKIKFMNNLIVFETLNSMVKFDLEFLVNTLEKHSNECEDKQIDLIL